MDALILTTGIVSAPTRQVTSEGIERELAISYLSRVEIVRAAAERLGAARPSVHWRPRIFVMGLPGGEYAGTVDDLNSERRYDQFAAHMTTVAGNEALVLYAAQRWPEIGVFGLNPGLIKTDLRSNAFGGRGSLLSRAVEWLVSLVNIDADTYAERLIPVLFAPELEGHSGFHFNQKGQPIRPSAVMTEAHVAALLGASDAVLARCRAP